MTSEHTCDRCGRDFTRTEVPAGFLDPDTCHQCWVKENPGQKFRAPETIVIEWMDDE